MDAALEAQCLACVRYRSGDALGRALAAACLAPYFAAYSVALLAYSTRELHLAFAVLGTVLNAGLSKAVKRLARHARPQQLCAALGTCHKYGMPSSHAQVMAFALAWRLLVGVRRWQRGAAGGQHTALFAAEAAGLAALTGVVGAARVYLGYHSADQVLAGVVLGAAAAAAWFAAVGAVAPAVLPAVLRRSAPLRALVLRDTLWRAKPD